MSAIFYVKSGLLFNVDAAGDIGSALDNRPSNIYAATSINAPSIVASSSLTIASLSGVLKSAAGVVSGSASTTDLPEGSNLYYTVARVETVGDGRYLKLNGDNSPMTGAVDFGGFQIHNLADPTSAQDAATQAYVLAQVGVSAGDLHIDGSNYMNGGAAIGWASDGASGSNLGDAAHLHRPANAYIKLLMQSGSAQITSFSVAGVVHNDSSGNLSSSLIVNADVDASAAIAYSKLALSNSIKASDQNSQSATSVQPLFADGSGNAAYRNIVSGDLPDLSGIYANINLSNLASPTAINQHLLFSSDGTKNIGYDGSSFSRPAAIAASAVIQVGGTASSGISNGFAAVNNGNTQLFMESFASGSQHPAINIATGSGTQASPGVTGALKVLGAINFQAYDAVPSKHTYALIEVYTVNGLATDPSTSMFFTVTNTTNSNNPGMELRYDGNLQLDNANLTFSNNNNIGDNGANNPTNAYINSLMSSGSAQITSFTSVGVVHNDASGNLSSSLIVNADVSSSAAIAYSKLALSNSIVNADINSAAAIAYSKLNLSNSIVSSDLASSLQSSYFLRIDGSNSPSADINWGGFKITNLANPVGSTDAVNKIYVDGLFQGVSWKNVVRVASIANLNLASMPASIQGVSLNSGDRFLAKNQTAPAENGIYIFNGAASAATRSLDADTAVELTWATVEVGNDDPTLAGFIYRESDDIVTLGTDPVAFVNVSQGISYVFTNGLQQIGNVVSVEPLDLSLVTSGSGVKVNRDPAGAIGLGASGILVNVDGSTIDISGNNIEVKAGGITNTQVNASAAIAYSKLALSNSIVNADINSAAAIAYSKLALSNSIKASDQNSQSATSTQPLFADGSGGSTYRSIVAGDLPSLSGIYANIALSNLGTTAINANLLFGSDGTNNIGAASASRPNIVYSKSSVRIGTNTGETGIIYLGSQGANIEGNAAGYVNFNPGSGGQPLTMQGDVLFYADGAFDLGHSAIYGFDRPNNLYVKTKIETAGTFSLSAASGSNILWVTDGSGSIGYDGSAFHRPDSAYIKSTIGTPLVTGYGEFVSTSNNGGSLLLTAGNQAVASATGNGGTITIQSGSVTGTGSTGASGQVILNTGTTVGGFANQITFKIGGSAKWVIGSSGEGGNFLCATDGANSIGGNGYDRPSAAYILNTINLNSLTASTVLVSDASKNIISSTVSSSSLLSLLNNEPLATFNMADNQSAAANVESWAFASFSSIILEYSISRGAGNRENGSIYIVTDGTSTSIAISGGSIGASGVVFSAVISGSNVVLQYTSTSTGTAPVMKYTVQKWLA